MSLTGQAARHTDQIDRTMPPLGGVVHAAMVLRTRCSRYGSGQLHRVLAPKMQGALNLHEATRTHAVDFFVLYSSADDSFGNPGQAATSPQT